MIDRYLFVFFERDHTLSYPTRGEIKRIFRVYGGQIEILSNPKYRNYFFIVYSWPRFAQRCYDNAEYLYKKHGFIVEQSAAVDVEPWNILEPSGAEDPDQPTMLQLNDDCLLNILKYLPLDSKAEFVCRRLNRLWFYERKRVKRLEVTPESLKLHHIFHYGDVISHLSLTDFTHSVNVHLRNIIQQTCKNLTSLSLVGCQIDRNTLKMIKSIVTPVTELNLDFKSLRNSSVEHLQYILSLCNEKLQVLKIVDRHMWYATPLLIPVQSQRLLRLPPFPCLTTLLLPLSVIDVASLLNICPTLRVLACILGVPSSITHTSFPNFHGLIELSVFLVDDVMTDFLRIREVCPNLRHLRVTPLAPLGSEDSQTASMLENIKQMLPLDGLMLTFGFKLSADFISHFMNDLRIFIPLCYEHDAIIPELLSNFPKLELVMFHSLSPASIASLQSQLSSRTTPLTIISPDSPQNHQSQKVIWRKNRRDVFGPFSIYGLPLLPCEILSHL